MRSALRSASGSARIAALRLFLLAGAAVLVTPGPSHAVLLETPQQSVRLRDGFAAIEAGKLADARTLFEGLRRENADLAGPYLGLAEIAVRERKLADAEAMLQAGIKAAPSVPALYRALGRIYVIQAKPDEAIDMFERAIKAGAIAVANWLELADLLNQRMGLPARSLPYYDKVIAADPLNVAAHYGKGLALLRDTKPGLPPPDMAWTELQRAQQLDPKGVLPLYAMAQARIGAGEPEKAIDVLEQAIRIKPDFVMARLTLGTTLLALRRYQASVAAFREALKVDPKAPNALAGLGMALQAFGDLAGAEATYRQALKLDARQPIVLNNLAALLADRKQNLDEALTSVQQAVQLVPNQPAFLDTLGWVNYQRGDRLAAEAAFKQSVERQPTPETLTRLGQVQADRGNKADAASSFRRALQLQPDFAPAKTALQKLG